jgi:hypothetical protein
VDGLAVRCTGGCYAPAGDAGACVNTAPVRGPPPQVVGCYVGTQACGWQKVACNCEVEAQNPSAAAAKVQFAFNVMPATVPPMLTGSPDVEIAFADPDGSSSAVWSAQSGSGTRFAVTRAAGKTTVRLGASSVLLAPVPLAASQSIAAEAILDGAPSGTSLEMLSAVTDATGHSLAVDTGTCVRIPPP